MEGNTFTVRPTLVVQPFELVEVIVVVPATMPVTHPVLLTDAIAVLELVQGLLVAAVPVPVNWV